jgi:hypothetical protein
MPCRIAIFGPYRAYTGARRAFFEPFPKVGQGRDFAFRPHLDIAVFQVSDPAYDAQASGLAVGRVAESHSLNAARDEGAKGRGAAAPMNGLRAVCQEAPP